MIYILTAFYYTSYIEKREVFISYSENEKDLIELSDKIFSIANQIKYYYHEIYDHKKCLELKILLEQFDIHLDEKYIDNFSLEVSYVKHINDLKITDEFNKLVKTLTIKDIIE